jgi:hypothetical protein
MSAESENFREVRRLLALKRYEQPPPGYFNRFSQQVIARIQAGERGSDHSVWELLFGQIGHGSWLLRLWSSFGTKPILAGAFGITVCSVLIAGVAYSDRDPVNSQALAVPTHEQGSFAQMRSAGGLLQPISATTAVSGTGGVVSAEERTSLFQEVQRARPQLILDVVTPRN